MAIESRSNDDIFYRLPRPFIRPIRYRIVAAQRRRYRPSTPIDAQSLGQSGFLRRASHGGRRHTEPTVFRENILWFLQCPTPSFTPVAEVDFSRSSPPSHARLRRAPAWMGLCLTIRD